MEKGISPEYLADDQTRHLTYLTWDFALFENEADAKILNKDLVCAACGHPITKVAEKIDIRGRHGYRFTNLGYPIQLGCYRTAPGCIGTGRVSNGYSWFRGYNWEIQLCNHCYTQVGWKYMTAGESFYALVFKMLREADPEEANAEEAE
ncbi:hypothetical protein DSCO28_56290 [Desulfosarcina ovata subsp. sediminis]|uniref:CULT domain-containing protein n=1 Tax=Desulfosarcina ovata subsp. sediminis TaxID=885957 RepID=A0A5K7ZXS3_9BACT|nr:cereblon family protein [Desulfosarcina ovata]BBO85063.1 hypothetical protein DSCO28_56290 [Desulfosarcina ovata subsp. sediminis]